MLKQLERKLRRSIRSEQPYSKDFFSSQQEGSRRSAQIVLPIVLDRVKPRKVIDVGCGVGTWAAELLAKSIDVIGLDGSYIDPAQLQIAPERFVAVDLEHLPSASTFGTFDLAICLEVGEHLRPERAGDLVGFLTSVAPAVLFSAAIPGQGGNNHLNEQWQSHWIERFSAHGFGYADLIRPVVWDNPEVECWYAQNSLLFLKGLTSPEGVMPTDIVHPRLFAIHRGKPK